jgi:hypothetical protein
MFESRHRCIKGVQPSEVGWTALQHSNQVWVAEMAATPRIALPDAAQWVGSRIG